MEKPFDIRLPSIPPSFDSPQTEQLKPDEKKTRGLDTFHPAKKSTNNSKDSQNPNRILHQTLRWMEKHYGLSVKVITEEKQITETFNSKVLLHPIEEEKKLEKIIALKKQLMKFPPQFVKKMGLKHIVLSGQPLERINEESKVQKFVGLTNGSGRTIYLSEAWCFTHEFFHFMESQKDLLKSYMTSDTDPPWMIQENLWYKLDQQNPPRNTDEEQAEYSRILFNLDNPKIVEEQYTPKMATQGGEAKFAQTKDWLFEWSDGRLDDQYWQDLQAGLVDEHYWKNHS